jgi:hypothetical protein
MLTGVSGATSAASTPSSSSHVSMTRAS